MGTTAWLPDDIALLRTLWDRDLSARQMMHYFQFRFSRSSICGKIHREGFPERAVGQNHGTRIYSSRGPKPPKPIAPPTLLPSLTVPIPCGPVGEIAPAGGCKWPMHPEGMEFQACGHPRQDRRPYCPHHNSVAFVKPQSRAR